MSSLEKSSLDLSSGCFIDIVSYRAVSLLPEAVGVVVVVGGATSAEHKLPKPTLKRTNACEDRQRRDRTPTQTATLLFSAQGLFVHMAAPLIAEVGRENKRALLFANRNARRTSQSKAPIPTPIVNPTRPTAL